MELPHLPQSCRRDSDSSSMQEHPSRRHALGFVLLDVDEVCEGDLYAMCHAASPAPLTRRLALHFTRVRKGATLGAEELRAVAGRLPDASALLVPGAPLDVLLFACTSASALIGDSEVRRLLQQGRAAATADDGGGGVGPTSTPATTTTTLPSTLMAASVNALRAVGCRRLALATPYTAQLTAEQARVFASPPPPPPPTPAVDGAVGEYPGSSSSSSSDDGNCNDGGSGDGTGFGFGFEVVSARCLDLDNERDVGRVRAEDIRALAHAAFHAPTASPAHSPAQRQQQQQPDQTAHHQQSQPQSQPRSPQPPQPPQPEQAEVQHRRPDAVFLSCSQLRAVPEVARLEAQLGVPVLCSNQVLLWEALRLAGADDPIHGFGSLLEMPHRSAAVSRTEHPLLQAPAACALP